MEIKLKDVIISANTGADAIRRAPIVDHDTGIKCLRIGDISNRRKYSDWGYTNVDEDNYKRYKLRKGNIIIARTGSTVGINKYIENDCKAVYNNGLIRLVIDETKYNSRFIYYIIQMKEFRNYINGIAFGTTGQPNIQINDLLNFKFNNIILEKQNKIVNILENIDKKIELNNQINDNLHTLIKSIYCDTFINNKSAYWEKERLGNYLTVERGLSYKGKYLAESGTPMINLGNVMPDGVFRLEKNKYYTGEYKEKVTANVGDIVVANTDMTQNREVIGTPVIIPSLYEGKVIFSHHIYGLKDLKLPKMYVFYSLLTDEWNGIAGGSATGTTVLALPKDAIEEYLIYIPDNATLDKFEILAENIQKKREQILLENIKLEQLRDTLLPKLMNGEIDLDKIQI